MILFTLIKGRYILVKHDREFVFEIDITARRWFSPWYRNWQQLVYWKWIWRLKSDTDVLGKLHWDKYFRGIWFWEFGCFPSAKLYTLAKLKTCRFPQLQCTSFLDKCSLDRMSMIKECKRYPHKSFHFSPFSTTFLLFMPNSNFTFLINKFLYLYNTV
jgi:hypothetical protein